MVAARKRIVPQTSQSKSFTNLWLDNSLSLSLSLLDTMNMRYIKSFLTGTTLVAASTTGIMADPPKGIELIPGVTITHPIFGKMKVISHEKDIGYYNGKAKCLDSADAKALVENFMAYVLDGHSYKENEVSEKAIQSILDQQIAVTKSGRGMLKVITANYMREYDRIGEFCKANKEALVECYEESLKHKAYLEHCCLTEKLKRDYEIEVNMSERETNETFASMQKEGSESVFLDLYKCFNEELGMDAVLGAVLNVPDSEYKQRLLNIYKERYFKKLEAFCNAHKSDLEKLSGFKKREQVKEIEKFMTLGQQLAKEWKDATQKQQEESFSCIRREDIPVCYFPILYAHFILKDKSYSNIKDVNNYLFRTLRLISGQGGLGIEKFELAADFGMKKCDMYYVNADDKFFDRKLGDEGEIQDKLEKYSALHHELIHLMNDCCIHDSKEFCEWNKDAIEAKKMGLQLSCDDFKEKTDGDEDIPCENVFDFHRRCCEDPDDVCRQCKAKEGALKSKVKGIKETLCGLYDNDHEMWTMYGILFTLAVSNSEGSEDDENSDESDSEDRKTVKGEFYYDPINEAVSNAECKFFGKADNGVHPFKKMKLVRTGHILLEKPCNEEYVDEFSKAMENSKKERVKAIEKLAEKKKIYKFYFDEKLRNLIPE